MKWAKWAAFACRSFVRGSLAYLAADWRLRRALAISPQIADMHTASVLVGLAFQSCMGPSRGPACWATLAVASKVQLSASEGGAAM